MCGVVYPLETAIAVTQCIYKKKRNELLTMLKSLSGTFKEISNFIIHFARCICNMKGRP